MSDGDHTAGVRPRQGYIAELVQLVVKGMAHLFPPPPIEPQQLYTRREAMRRAKIGNTTWSAWVRLGLRVHQRGTSAQYVLGKDLIDFICGGDDATKGKARARRGVDLPKGQ